MRLLLLLLQAEATRKGIGTETIKRTMASTNAALIPAIIGVESEDDDEKT